MMLEHGECAFLAKEDARLNAEVLGKEVVTRPRRETERRVCFSGSTGNDGVTNDRLTLERRVENVRFDCDRATVYGIR